MAETKTSIKTLLPFLKQLHLCPDFSGCAANVGIFETREFQCLGHKSGFTDQDVEVSQNQLPRGLKRLGKAFQSFNHQIYGFCGIRLNHSQTSEPWFLLFGLLFGAWVHRSF